MSIADFKLTHDETRALEELKEDLCAYMYQKQITIAEYSGFVFLFFKAHKVKNTEKSMVTYLRVLDAVSDSKDTMMEVLQELHRQFIVNQGKQCMIVEGDAKLCEICNL